VTGTHQSIWSNGWLDLGFALWIVGCAVLLALIVYVVYHWIKGTPAPTRTMKVHGTIPLRLTGSDDDAPKPPSL
jgi:tellurite resistance protein TehA-like permease